MRALVNPFKVSLEIKKEGKLGSKNTTGTSQSLTFEEQNFQTVRLTLTISDIHIGQVHVG